MLLTDVDADGQRRKRFGKAAAFAAAWANRSITWRERSDDTTTRGSDHRESNPCIRCVYGCWNCCLQRASVAALARIYTYLHPPSLSPPPSSPAFHHQVTGSLNPTANNHFQTTPFTLQLRMRLLGMAQEHCLTDALLPPESLQSIHANANAVAESGTQAAWGGAFFLFASPFSFPFPFPFFLLLRFGGIAMTRTRTTEPRYGTCGEQQQREPPAVPG